MGQGANQSNPYNAFAAPQGQLPQTQAYYDNPYGAAAAAQAQAQQPSRHAPAKSTTATEASLDLLEAAGLSAGAGAAGAALNRNKSLGANTLGTTPSEYSTYTGTSGNGTNAAYGGYYNTQLPPGARPPSMGDPFAAQYNHTPQQQQPQQQQPQQQQQQQQQGYLQPSPAASDDRLSAAELPNPFGPSRGASGAGASASPEPLLGTKFNSPESTAENGEDDDDDHEPPAAGWQNQESRHSLRDEEDYGFGGGRRVLKVRLSLSSLHNRRF